MESPDIVGVFLGRLIIYAVLIVPFRGLFQGCIFEYAVLKHGAQENVDSVLARLKDNPRKTMEAFLPFKEDNLRKTTRLLSYTHAATSFVFSLFFILIGLTGLLLGTLDSNHPIEVVISLIWLLIGLATVIHLLSFYWVVRNCCLSIKAN